MASVSAENLRPKVEDTLGLGAVLALAAHLLLVLALAFGVSWRTHTLAVAEAEVWSEVPTAAAPAAEPPPPTPPEPVVEKTMPAPVAQVEPEPAPEPEAEIPRAPVPKKVKRKKEKPLPPVVAQVEPKPLPKSKKAPAEPKETFITDKPVASKKPASVPSSAPVVSSAEREAQRKSALQRMMKDLGSLGTSEHSAGPSVSYTGKLRARIIPNITFLIDSGNGNPTAFVEIRCAPDGTILSRRLLEPSGSPAWDKAVLDGIDKTRSLPFDESGRLPDTVFQIGISPKDR